MTRFQWPTRLAFLSLLMILAALPSSVAAQSQSLTLTLNAQNNSGISGTATLTDLGDGKTRVAIQATGAGAGPEPFHIHPGSCAQLEPTPAFSLQSVTNGSSTTDVNATLQQLIDGHYAVHMHKSNDELTVYVACADIARSGPAARLPNTGGVADDWTGPAAAVAGLGLAIAGVLLRRRPASVR